MLGAQKKARRGAGLKALLKVERDEEDLVSPGVSWLSPV